MFEYAILLDPGHNQVYFESAKALSLAEFSYAAPKLQAVCEKADIREIEGVPYLVFKAESTLAVDDVLLLARLSFAYALFSVTEEDSSVTLRPFRLSSQPYIPHKISALLKYSGKTNEQFTRMMINVACAVSDFSPLVHLRLLDPLAGKGTTLYEGLVYGFDVWGVEQDKKQVKEACVFLKKFLETERLKHTQATETIHTSKESQALKTEFLIAKSKADQKEGTAHQAALVSGDTRYIKNIIRKTRFHLIVSDLPYGIQHGNVHQRGNSSSRNPLSLLKSALPGWYNALLPGGAMVLAWNTFMLSPKDLGDLVASFGFEVITPIPASAFSHRVSQAINRDIIIAKKPK